MPDKTKIILANDNHSFSKPNEAVVKHLDWIATIDFNSRIISAQAKWTIENKSNTDHIIFDTRDMEIESVILNNDTPALFSLANTVADQSYLGRALTVKIFPAVKTITIIYKTSHHAAALQWLNAGQTRDKKYPFLFTQSQAILARTWIPCQDSPAVRFTYNATVQVPAEMLALMSAENPQQKNDTGKYIFKMDNPLPSYLMALTAGDIVFKPTGNKTGVYAEPSFINAVANEFSDMQKMLGAAEKLYGTYRWGRYDVIVLPPAFPFGGMENPRLTFATPTVIAGDKSLVSLIAHELAHSWSGNLVTNATWDDFWLNEGFTVYFENRIMEEVYGKEFAEMEEALGYETVQNLINELGNTSADTHLKLNLIGKDPDNGMNDIAYEKGNLFLKLLEQTVTRPSFDAFINKWFNQNAFQSKTTEDFIVFLNKNLIEPDKEKFADVNINAWIYGPGLPANTPKIASLKFEKVDAELLRFNNGIAAKNLYAGTWSTQEWLRFINHLPANISIGKMKELDEAFHFTASGNAEIEAVWFELAIKRKYTEAYSAIENFLCTVGRRKFLTPLYKAMLNTAQKELAEKIYSKARPGYHYVAVNTMDELLGWKNK